MRYFLIIFFFIELNINGYSQDSVSIFYYPNGKISSKGKLVNNKPDGYWITFHENGKIKSEGNRINYLLDGTWKFYNEKGNIVLEISYFNDKKNGNRTTYLDDEILVEQYVDNIKDGPTILFDSAYRKIKQIPFKNGKEHGLGKFFDKSGLIIEIVEYVNGFVTNREKINRMDKNMMKQGKWKWFYPNDIMKQQGYYVNNKSHGIFKYYDVSGNLINIERYHYGELIKDAIETAQYEIKRSYYRNGNIKIEASYLNNLPEGITRQFDSISGNIEMGYLYANGVLIGQGIVDEEGFKVGNWIEYFENGSVRSEGLYKKGLRYGLWKFYYFSGQLEQIGYFLENELPDKEWKWYYEDQQILRLENYINGFLDGDFMEYDDSGKIVIKGQYFEGQEDGFWEINYGDYKVEGNFLQGAMNGEWKSFYNNGQLLFKGNYIDDNPDGKHIYYWDNGLIKEVGNYLGYQKEGPWNYYSRDGELIISITYNNGRELKYDGIDID